MSFVRIWGTMGRSWYCGGRRTFQTRLVGLFRSTALQIRRVVVSQKLFNLEGKKVARRVEVSILCSDHI